MSRYSFDRYVARFRGPATIRTIHPLLGVPVVVRRTNRPTRVQAIAAGVRRVRELLGRAA